MLVSLHLAEHSEPEDPEPPAFFRMAESKWRILSMLLPMMVGYGIV